MSDGLSRLRGLAEQLPSGLVSDWIGTNHYELTTRTASGDHWWLCLGGSFESATENHCETVEGKRIGLLMDIAAEVARLRDEGLI